jgi:hypothetical protein
VAAVRRLAADAVVMEGNGGLSALGLSILHTRPQAQLLTVSADGRRATLYHLVPTRLEMSDVSPQELVDAVRASGRFRGSS